MSVPTTLKGYLATPDKMVIAPAAYDGLSARLIANAGFETIYMTGAGTAASRLGQPDIGLATLNEMVSNAAMIVECTGLPVIADADTGYGNPLNVIRTVREYEQAGVAAIHIEDQVSPKRCGHLAGKQVIPAKEFIQKIKAAVDARRSSDFLIIARTDAGAIYGLEEAIARANLYVEAGADVAFVEAAETVEELEQIPRQVKAPCLANMPGPGTRTPPVAAPRLQQMGYKIAIYPTVCLAPALHGIKRALSVLKESGMGWNPSEPMTTLEFYGALGMEEWSRRERKYVTNE
jgi:2-methylisocitrate lyase-like PEP mutase family enzyme